MDVTMQLQSSNLKKSFFSPLQAELKPKRWPTPEECTAPPRLRTDPWPEDKQVYGWIHASDWGSATRPNVSDFEAFRSLVASAGLKFDGSTQKCTTPGVGGNWGTMQVTTVHCLGKYSLRLGNTNSTTLPGIYCAAVVKIAEEMIECLDPQNGQDDSYFMERRAASKSLPHHFVRGESYSHAGWKIVAWSSWGGATEWQVFLGKHERGYKCPRIDSPM